MAVGVLAIQGSFNEHIAALRKLGVKGIEIRKPEQLQIVAALILPGGESTTMAKLAEYHNLFPALRELVLLCESLLRWENLFGGHVQGLFSWQTKPPDRRLVGRNWLEALIELFTGISSAVSFEAELEIPEVAAKEGGPPSFRGVFIRAPAILEVGQGVQVLADILVSSNISIPSGDALLGHEENLRSEKKVIVAVRQGKLMGTAFHPELTADARWHSYFLRMVNESEEGALSYIFSREEDTSCYESSRNIDLSVFL